MKITTTKVKRLLYVAQSGCDLSNLEADIFELPHRHWILLITQFDGLCITFYDYMKKVKVQSIIKLIK